MQDHDHEITQRQEDTTAPKTPVGATGLPRISLPPVEVRDSGKVRLGGVSPSL